MDTPIIFIIFNRPITTQKVFDEIKKIKPKYLYVIADGPRPNKPNEIKLCHQTRKIIEQVNWPCKIIKDYSKSNLGCKIRLSSGITNAFKSYDQAIILEDDCMPNNSFFKFCEEMLFKYKNIDDIMCITGDNFLFNKQSIITDSYYFSEYPNIWGWATWKRAWNKYDVKISSWPTNKSNSKYPSNFNKMFDMVYENKIDTWDIQWLYSCLVNKGLTIVPSKNLVSNIGFGNNSTHTTFKTIVADMKTEELSFPLNHPQHIIPNTSADKISRYHFTRVGIIFDFIKNYVQKL